MRDWPDSIPPLPVNKSIYSVSSNRGRPAQIMNSLCHNALVLAAVCLVAISAVASDHQGVVRTGEVPVPGASIQAVRGTKPIQALTDSEGRYLLPNLDDGTWTFQVQMLGFETIRRDVAISADGPAEQWNLKMLPLPEIQTQTVTGFPPTATAGIPMLQSSPVEAEAADRLLINGSIINGASTPFALQRAFGNVRAPRSPYRGTASFSGNSSLFDARPYSLTGRDTLDPAYARIQASFTIGGPLQIPGLFRNGAFTAW